LAEGLGPPSLSLPLPPTELSDSPRPHPALPSTAALFATLLRWLPPDLHDDLCPTARACRGSPGRRVRVLGPHVLPPLLSQLLDLIKRPVLPRRR